MTSRWEGWGRVIDWLLVLRTARVLRSCSASFAAAAKSSILSRTTTTRLLLGAGIAWIGVWGNERVCGRGMKPDAVVESEVVRRMGPCCSVAGGEEADGVAGFDLVFPSRKKSKNVPADGLGETFGPPAV